MLGEFLLRLAIALPLVCAAAAFSLWAVKRGWIRLPRMALKAPAIMADTPLALVAVKSLSPAARVAIIRFDGRDHLIGVAGQAITLLASAALPEAASTRPAIGQTAPEIA